jgi:hypothetical protein
MGHPLIDEFIRIGSLQTFRVVVFRRMQRVFRDEINPLLDERDRLVEEIARVKEQHAAEVASLTAEIERLTASLDAARGKARKGFGGKAAPPETPNS